MKTETETEAAEPQDTSHVVHLSGSECPLKIFPFVTSLHREVVLRHKDDESQDIELTPDEADQVANLLKDAAARARAAAEGEPWPAVKIELSGSAPLEIFPYVTSLHRDVVLRHKDGESQDIELTPDEANLVAGTLHTAAAAARAAEVD